MKRPIEDVSIQKLNNDKLDLSNSEVQLDMGRRFLYGFGVPKNANETFKWFTLSAEQGNVDAIKNLGHCYRSGIGIESDYSEAVKWYLKAAGQGNAEAQYHLGKIYSLGKGIERDYSRAIEWFMKAARQEHIFAQFALEKATSFISTTGLNDGFTFISPILSSRPVASLTTPIIIFL